MATRTKPKPRSAVEILDQDREKELVDRLRAYGESADSFARKAARTLETLYAKGSWLVKPRLDGKPFESFRQWLEYPRPHGGGIGRDDGTIPIEGIAARIAADLGHGHPILQHLEAKVSSGKKGGDGSNQHAGSKSGTSRLAIQAARNGTREEQKLWLQIHHPEIWKRLMAGEFKSVNAAMVEAGVGVKHSSHYDRVRRSWNCLTKKERTKFLKELERHNYGDVPARTKRGTAK